MYGEASENIMYYLTVYNEPYLQPEAPKDLDVEGLLRGIYLYSPSQQSGRKKRRANILASGIALNAALKAQKMLAEDWGIQANVWSVTSWNELRRDGLAVDRHNLLHPKDKKTAYLTEKLKGFGGSVLAVSDYMRTVQDQIAPWVPNGFSSLGTDGFGLSDTRGALRRHFKIDAESITVGVLAQLAKEGKISDAKVQAALDSYRLTDVTAADPGNTEGTG
jgi:pyruvate dehydrogenase E1 component